MTKLRQKKPCLSHGLFPMVNAEVEVLEKTYLETLQPPDNGFLSSTPREVSHPMPFIKYHHRNTKFDMLPTVFRCDLVFNSTV